MFKKIVVVGMGYVGIPVSAEFANYGFDVIGIGAKRIFIILSSTT